MERHKKIGVLQKAALIGTAFGSGVSWYTVIYEFSKDSSRQKAAISSEKINDFEPGLQEIPELSEETLIKVQPNVLSLNILPRKGYEYYFTSGGCSGFLTRNDKGELFYVTAKHCMPDVVKHPDGNTYKLEDENGNSLLNVTAKDLYGRLYSASFSTFYFDTPDRKNDIIANKIINDSDSMPGFELSKDKPKFADPAYFLSRAEDFDKAVDLNYLYEDEKSGNRVYIYLGESKFSCKPGTSGSAIFDKDGRVTSVLVSHNEIVLNKEYVKYLGIDESNIGFAATLCNGTPIELVQSLVNSNQ